jgi:hypothetical protein
VLDGTLLGGTIMWWLYLDESGDLGFDFVNKKPSRFFTICILATSRPETNRVFKCAVKRTLRNKVNPKGHRSRMATELKGSASTGPVKEYALRHAATATFGLYAITLNKRRVFPRLAEDKERVYNYIARQVIDHIPFEKATGGVSLMVDRSKNKAQIRDFNEHIRRQLEGRIDPSVALDFKHEDSRRSPGLQFADLFAWGIFRKYEHRDEEWYSLFKDKVYCDELFLGQ